MKQKQFNLNKAYRFKRFVRKAYSVFNSMHKVISIGVISGSMLTFVHITETSAQGNVPVHQPDSLPEQILEEVTVTAAKAELTLNQAAKLVTVITKEEIARQPVQSIQDLLKYVAGIDVRQRGANGVQSDISVRGGTFDQVAVLLNGANLTNPQTGHYSFDLPVNLSDIERIEIIQGPSSLLYGASAFSGGINIITKRRPDSKAYVNLESGMHKLFGVEANGTASFNSSTHQLSAGYNSSSGYTHASDYKIFNSLWQSHFLLEQQAKIDLQLGLNDKKYGASTFYSGAYPDQYDDTRSLFAAIKGEMGNKLKFIPQLYWNRHWDAFQLYRDGTPNIPDWYKGTNHHRSDVYGFNLNLQYKWKTGITNFGGEFRNEGILSNVLGKPLDKPDGHYTNFDNRSNISYFLEHTFLYKNLTIGLGVLANQNTSLHEDFSFYPNINASYLIDNLKFYASWNNAMRMPTFTDLYHEDPAQKGNPDLLPEKSEAYELGAKYRHEAFSIYLTGFYMKGKDVIDWVKEKESTGKYEARNLSKLDKKGIETGLSVNWGKIYTVLQNTRLNLTYTYINQTQDAGGLVSNYALDYLRHKFTAQLTHPIFKGISADWQFRWQDRMGSYTKYENLKTIGEVNYQAYSVLDLKINWKFKDFKVYLSANNLFDASYYDLGNIPQPGFWLTGGVSYIY